MKNAHFRQAAFKMRYVHMKKTASKSKPFQNRSKVEIRGRARREKRLSRSKLNEAFLIDSDIELFMYLVWLMKSLAYEPVLISLFSKW